MMLNKTIKKSINEFVNIPTLSFESILNSEVDICSYEIDCSKLQIPKYELKFHEYENQMHLLMQELMYERFNCPCLYWFSVDNYETAKKIISKLNDYRDKQSELDKTIKSVVPAKNSRKIEPNQNEYILYVGKRHGGINKDNFTNIAGRISIHFGYYKIGSTQGLQLVHWAKDKITLKIIPLPKESSEYLELLEKLLAKQLKPLCGKH